MKNEQLLLKTLCSGLPYGMNAIMLDNKIDYVGKEVDRIKGIYLLKDTWHCETHGGSRPSIDNVKPILYDLSYLTKPIWHKWEEIVPLQLLNEMRGVSVDPKDYKYDVFEDNEYWCYWGDKKYYGFSFEKQTMSFYDIGSAGISPQLELFEKLDELHIDHRGLIDLGLAVSVDTLKENPYK